MAGRRVGGHAGECLSPHKAADNGRPHDHCQPVPHTRPAHVPPPPVLLSASYLLQPLLLLLLLPNTIQAGEQHRPQIQHKKQRAWLAGGSGWRRVVSQGIILCFIIISNKAINNNNKYVSGIICINMYTRSCFAYKVYNLYNKYNNS